MTRREPPDSSAAMRARGKTVADSPSVTDPKHTVAAMASHADASVDAER